MHKINYILILAVFTLNVCVAQNKWIWSETKSNEKKHSDYPLADRKVYYAENQYDRAVRDREPTTKRPIPGQSQNDDIDDYADTNDEPTKQNSPYIPHGPFGHPLIARNYNGFAKYPQITGFPDNSPNGILVGPGGPTGIIGRPQAQYPVGVASPAFPTAPGGYPGYPVAQSFPGAVVNNNPGFPGFNGLNNVLGQYPYAIPHNPQHFAGAQYPQGQFPGAQHPQQPQYTEGYGLVNQNPGFNINPQFNGNFNPSYGFGFDEYPAQVEGKSARVSTIDKKVDDKVTKNLKKS